MVFVSQTGISRVDVERVLTVEESKVTKLRRVVAKVFERKHTFHYKTKRHKFRHGNKKIYLGVERQNSRMAATIRDGPINGHTSDERQGCHISMKTLQVQSLKADQRRKPFGKDLEKWRCRAAVGVDLGTCRSAIAVLENGTPRAIPLDSGNLTLPSVALCTRVRFVELKRILEFQRKVLCLLKSRIFQWIPKT